MKLNISLLLTILRIILVPFFILFYYMPYFWSFIVCLIFFIIASLTDLFDGIIARRFSQTTEFGKFLDPIADKIMVISILVLIVEHYCIWWITLPIIIIIVRETVISSLREWIIKFHYKNNISVSIFGKIKTIFQMISLFGLIWNPGSYVEIISIVFLYFSVFLTFFSLLHYLYIFFKKN